MKTITTILIILLMIGCATPVEPVTRGVEKESMPPTWREKVEGKTEGITVFKTAYGTIPKEATMSGVMSIFGQPYAIQSEKSSEIWCYDFGRGEKIFVYFVNGSVVNVKAQ